MNPDDVKEILLDIHRRLAEQSRRDEDLQRQVHELQKRLDALSEPTQDAAEVTVTRAVARSHAVVMLEKNNPGISATKGSRADGSGIVITSVTAERLLAKFYYSRSYPDPEGEWHGWHTVLLPVIEDRKFDLHIFCTWHDGQYFNFIFSRDELQSFVKQKEVDNRDLVHFYFKVQDNRGTEYRDGVRDVTHYLERWNLASIAMPE